jgi:hypothetical protein
MAARHRNTLVARASVGGLFLVFAWISLAQERNAWGAPGEAKSGRVTCQVVEWNVRGEPLPQLTLACPPEGIFTPVRVYFVLSWGEKKDLPKDWAQVSDAQGYEARMRQGRKGIEVELKIYDKQKKERQRQWVLFTHLVRQAILEPDNGH